MITQKAGGFKYLFLNTFLSYSCLRCKIIVVMDMYESIKNIIDSETEGESDILMFYPLSDEVDLLPLFPCFKSDGHHVYFPVTKESGLEFYEVDSLDDFVPGALGVREPDRSGRLYKYDRRKTICLTPGTRFSKTRQRKGRGKGYYDRFLSDKDDILKVGVTTEAQVIPEMDQNPWDVDMDMVVTENRIL